MKRYNPHTYMVKPLSEDTRSLVESLYRPSFLRITSTKHKLATLDLIREAGEPAAIPELASLLLDRNEQVAQAAENVMSALSTRLSLAEFAWLNEVMRWRSPYRWTYPSAWAEMKPHHLDRLAGLGAPRVLALGMASFHFNGWVREHVLRRLATVKSGGELPFLLLRINDWVEEVRELAQQLVRERLTRNYAPFFVQNLVLLSSVGRGRRGQPHVIVEAIEKLLKSKDGQHAIEAALDSPDAQIVRACYRLAFASRLSNLQFVVEKALSRQDPVIRLWGTRDISFVKDDTLAARLLSQARADRFAPVRYTALREFSQRFPDAAFPWLEHALLDSHPSIRGYAQSQMGKQSNFDLRQFYRSALARSDSRSLYSAISGLGEIGALSDAALVAPYVSHEVPRVRRAALRALARLRAEDFVDVFEKSLADPTSGVSREAMKGLSKTIHLTDGTRIWRIFSSATALHTRRNALFLMARVGKWESIIYLVEALCTDNDHLRKLAEDYVRRWLWCFNRSFTVPEKAEVERVSEVFSRCGNKLEHSVKQVLESTIRAQRT